MRQHGAWGRGLGRIVLAAGLALGLTGCVATYRNHGYVPTENELAAVTVGRSTREDVSAIIGRPSAQALLSDDAWYYVQSRYRQIGPRAPQEIERQVVAVSYAADGTVSNIERFGLEDGQVVTLSRRVTETAVKPPGLLAQLLRNFGRIDAGQFIREE